MTLGRPLSQLSQRCIDIVRRQPGIGTAAIAERVGEPLHVVQKTLANLRQQNHIVHSGRRAVGSGWLPVEIQRVPLEAKPLRNGTTTGNWTAPKWEIARPEGNDHMKFGSLRGDTVVPHAPPISMCVGKGIERFMPDRLQR